MSQPTAPRYLNWDKDASKSTERRTLLSSLEIRSLDLLQLLRTRFELDDLRDSVRAAQSTGQKQEECSDLLGSLGTLTPPNKRPSRPKKEGHCD